jgi:hypothetical protein
MIIANRTLGRRARDRRTKAAVRAQLEPGPGRILGGTNRRPPVGNRKYKALQSNGVNEDAGKNSPPAPM